WVILSALVSALLLVPGAGAPAERAVAIPAAGGVTLAGSLLVPQGRGPVPGAVLVTGFGPNSRDGGRGAYRRMAEALARRGLAVLWYDKRGIGGSGGPALSWLDARPLAADAASAVRLLAAIPGIDTRRVTLIGHSQGGELAFEAARRSPAPRIVSLSAPGRPLGLLPRAAGTASRFLRRLVGPEVAAATLRRDPLRDAAAARQPALLVQGTADRTVPFADMARLAAVRRAAGLPTRTLPVPGAGHFLQVEGRVPLRVLDAVAAFAA
ncbi:MAG TPA: alpha/beta fold hydrolase, partial [Miltoncostaea sp.]|nr:alpha/beta fold hydrolase [Miltoncostaea sp.]